jgi:exopolysaccharide biosynthesis protein
MERARTDTTEGKMRWKKVGGGSLRLGGRIIKPGQVFEAFPSEISKSFKNLVISLDGDVEVWKDETEKVVLPSNIVKPVYVLQPHGKSLYLFDIVDGQGKILNEKSLKKEVAEKLIIDLQK